MARKSALNPKPNGSLREQAYSQIQRRIASGELRPDVAISELLLARELRMSRTPVREALSQLVAEGLLEQTPNRGTVVVQLKRQDIIDLYELREALEVYSARKAAQSTLRPIDLERWKAASDEVLRLLDELRTSGKPALTQAEMHRFVGSDLNFHNMLMRLAVNDRMLKVVNETRLLIRIFAIRREGYDARTLERIYLQHHAIVQAVQQQNSELVTRLLSEHIRNSLQERLDAYDLWEHEVTLRSNLPVFEG
jgi:DNA-binding GntR family transcriptional regulator